MPTPEARRRRLLGWFIVSASVVITLIVAFRVHQETNVLREQQDITNSVIHSDEYPLAIVNAHGKVIEWNVGMERLTGLSSEDAKEYGFGEMICSPASYESHSKGLATAIQRANADGKVKIVNCEVKNVKTKAIIPVQIRVCIVKARNDVYALARIDKKSEIEEITQEPTATLPSNSTTTSN